MDDLEDLARRQRRERERARTPQRAPKPERTSYVTDRGPLLRLFPEWLPVAFSVLVAIGGIAWNAFDDGEEPRSHTRTDRVERTVPVSSYDPVDWITADDYPYESIRREEQGRVRISWIVTPEGGAATCRVIETSGYPRLDEAACNAITRRARYRPEDRGTATDPRVQTRRVVWRLPE